MNEKVKKHLAAYAEKQGWGTSDKELFEILMESKVIYSEIVGEHRWYEDEFRVVEVDGMLIGYEGFHTTGDASWRDMDLEHDIKTIREVSKKEKTVVVYE